MSSSITDASPKIIHISQETVKRLARDVKDIRKNPLTSNGIYYHHHEENLLKGYALVIGPSETIYEGGYYFFEFDYPPDYPASPPKVIFRTNKDHVRFNPNLYTNGKVCLSLLNTWRGEQWTSCQTISTVLLTLCTLFTNTPLLNEPGVQKNHRDFNNYNRIIEYANIEIAIINIIDKHPHLYLPFFDYFYDDILQHFKSNLNSIQHRVNNLYVRNSLNTTVKATTSLYSMDYILDYRELKQKYKRLYNKHTDTLSKCPPSSEQVITDYGDEECIEDTDDETIFIKSPLKKISKATKTTKATKATKTTKTTKATKAVHSPTYIQESEISFSEDTNLFAPSESNVFENKKIHIKKDEETDMEEKETIAVETPVKKTRSSKSKLKVTS
jgi:ubiquitin-protein ligase